VANLRHLRISARKVRLVVDTIRGEDVEKALNLLTFSPKSAARPLAKLLQSAVANAEVKGDYDLDKLYVKLATVDEGSTWRRWRPRAQGRATRIRKRTSHVSLELAQR
jgi:large subunit ribosomal protein L22